MGFKGRCLSVGFAQIFTKLNLLIILNLYIKFDYLLFKFSFFELECDYLSFNKLEAHYSNHDYALKN